MIITSNPKFIKNTPVSLRRRWATALNEAELKGIRQAHGKMVYANQHGKYMCCLMVGHEEFGGDNSTRNENLPTLSSPFSLAFCRIDSINNNKNIDDEEFDPLIAVDEYGGEFSAAELNDEHRLSFKQIASLIYSFSGNYPSIQIRL